MWSYFKQLLPVHLFFFYVFIASGLIVNSVQLLTLIIWPFNKPLYRKLNTYLAYALWSEFTWLAQYWSGSTCELYIKEEDFKYVAKEHAICICNHKYDIDWLMGWIICQRAGLLSGSKIIGKSSLKYIPIIGWCWMFTESIFIKRKWDSDKKTLIKDLDSVLVDYPKDHYFNILMFCEGTRFTKLKHEESMKIAREKGYPELKHHLLPRTKGFCLLAKGAAGRIEAIYDLTVGIESSETKKPDFNTVRKGIPLKGEMFVRRIPFSSVPQDEEAASEFLQKLYREKDEIFDVYHKTGSFKSLGVKRLDLPANYYDFYIVAFWMALLIPPLVYYSIVIFTQASLFARVTFAVILLIANLVLKMFVAVTQSNSGSGYGLDGRKTQ